MAIVKMSEFELFIQNNKVDSLLLEFQKFENITFSSGYPELPGFSKCEGNYDYDENNEKRMHIQEILKRLNVLKKKDSNKLSVKDLGLQTLSYEALNQLTLNNDLDTILSFYAEHYDKTSEKIGSFKMASSQSISNFPIKTLESMLDVKAVIGIIDGDNIDKFIKELIRGEDVIVLYQPHIVDKPSMFAVFTTKEYRESVIILSQKYLAQARSAASLHIEDKITNVRNMLKGIVEKHETLNDRISAIGFYQDVLKAHYESLNNEALREKTKEGFMSSKNITLIKGWVFTENADLFEEIVKVETDGIYDLNIYETPKHSKDVPIKLRNNKFVSAFEMITNMYSQPRYNEPDPTPLFSVFYAVFFGMMLADLGYGLLMFIVMFIALRTIELKPGTKNMVRMLFYVSIPTMVWGFIYGSFFGGLIPMNPIIDINSDFNTVLVMALGMGIVHLFFGLAIKGAIYIRDYKFKYVIYDVVFWYMTLIGAIVLVTQIFTDALSKYASIALPVMVVGMVGIVLTNGRDAKTLPGKLISGLYSLYGITNYVGDVVSYSRLMALGLAGASIGVAFNMMIDMVSGMGVISVLLGAVIFMIGHTFNLLISGLSSYVHAARLTYVEFFGKFFVGGGKAFKPFIATPTYIKIGEEV